MSRASACAVIERSDGCLLLIRPVKHGGRPELPGGKTLLDRGDGQPETLRDALARDLREETGGEIAAAEPVGVFDLIVPSTGEAHTCTVYAVRLLTHEGLRGSAEGPIAWEPRDALLADGTYRDLVRQELDAYDAFKARHPGAYPMLAVTGEEVDLRMSGCVGLRPMPALARYLGPSPSDFSGLEVDLPDSDVCRLEVPQELLPSDERYRTAHARLHAAEAPSVAPVVRLDLSTLRERANASEAFHGPYDPEDVHCGNPHCSPGGESDCPGHSAGLVVIVPEHSDGESDDYRCTGPKAEATAAFLATARADVLALAEELGGLREYEARTRSTICWGVACVHEASALDLVANGMRELDELRAELARLSSPKPSLWRTAPPTPEESKAHTLAHPALYHSSGDQGLWQVRWTNGVGTHYEIIALGYKASGDDSARLVLERLSYYPAEWRPIDGTGEGTAWSTA